MQRLPTRGVQVMMCCGQRSSGILFWLQLLEGGDRVDAANDKLASGAANGVDNAISQARSCTRCRFPGRGLM